MGSTARFLVNWIACEMSAIEGRMAMLLAAVTYRKGAVGGCGP